MQCPISLKCTSLTEYFTTHMIEWQSQEYILAHYSCCGLAPWLFRWYWESKKTKRRLDRLEQQSKDSYRSFDSTVIVSSDRSSYSDVGLLHTRTTFSDFHSVLWCNWCYKCHSKSLKQYQCNWCHRMLIECECSNVPMFQCSNNSMFQCSSAPMCF